MRLIVRRVVSVTTAVLRFLAYRFASESNLATLLPETALEFCQHAAGIEELYREQPDCVRYAIQVVARCMSVEGKHCSHLACRQ